MLTKSALVGSFGLVIKKAGVIRTGLNAVAAAHALIVIDKHNAVFTLKGGLYGTHGHTGRVVAMVAQAWQAKHRRLLLVRQVDFILQDGRAKLPDRRLIFDGTANGARLATDAFAQINQHAVAFARFAGTAWWLVADGGFGRHDRYDSGRRTKSQHFLQKATSLALTGQPWM